MHSSRVFNSLFQLRDYFICLHLISTLYLQCPGITYYYETISPCAFHCGTFSEGSNLPALCYILNFPQLYHLLISSIKRFPTQKSSVLRNIQKFLMRLLGAFRMLHNYIPICKIGQHFLYFILF